MSCFLPLNAFSPLKIQCASCLHLSVAALLATLLLLYCYCSQEHGGGIHTGTQPGIN